MSEPTREQVLEWIKKAKIPKFMRDYDAGVDALAGLCALAYAAGAREENEAIARDFNDQGYEGFAIHIRARRPA